MITAAEIQVIRLYWFSISSNGLNISDDFYKRLFDDFPEYEQYFPTDRQVLAEKLTRVINIIVNGAEVLDHIEPMLVKLGQFHATLGDFTSQDYENVSSTLFTVMKNYKGHDDKVAEEVWHKIFSEVAAIMLNASKK